MFLSPETVRQDGVTVQVPTTSPPQGVTLAALLQATPLLVEVEPTLVPPPPFPLLVDALVCPPPPVFPVWLDLPPDPPAKLELFELPLEHEAPRSAKATAIVANRCCDLMDAPNREVCFPLVTMWTP
jgi:hypothetical protein